MTTFLNINLDGKTPNKFIWRHIVFSTLWLLGIFIIIFRIDIILLDKFNISINWLEGTLPIILIIIIGVTMIMQKWYYNLALIFYPALAIGWFIPKTVLRRGKMYLFLRYVNFIFTLFKKFKLTVLHFGLLSFAIFIPIMINSVWAKYFSIIAFTYFYVAFIIRYIKNSFRPAQLFGTDVEQFIDELTRKSKNNESWLITVLVLRNDKTENRTPENVNKALSRLIMINYALDTIVHRLNSFRGKRAYTIALLYELFIFLLSSVLFFWVSNFLLFKINSANFQISGQPNVFDFLYYSVKNITFSDIDAIKPGSWIAKTLEIGSFFIIGIFFFIIIISILFSLRNDKINENVKLTTGLCDEQNRVIKEYAINTYGKDIQTAMGEIANIGDSLKKLKNVIDKIF